MSFDAVRELASAGHNFKGATPQQLDAISSLSEEEVRLLNSVKQRLDSADEVTAHSTDAALGGTVVW